MRSPRAVYAQCDRNVALGQSGTATQETSVNSALACPPELATGSSKDFHSATFVRGMRKDVGSTAWTFRLNLVFPLFFYIVVRPSTVSDDFEKQTWEPNAFVIRVSAGGIVSSVVFSSNKS